LSIPPKYKIAEFLKSPLINSEDMLWRIVDFHTNPRMEWVYTIQMVRCDRMPGLLNQTWTLRESDIDKMFIVYCLNSVAIWNKINQ
jgi:hypothetical protein